MKALDTPVLLDLLRGAPAARSLLEKVGPEELATTEINLWELTVLAIQDRARGLEGRLAAIERLRRKLLVFPVDASSTQTFARQRSRRSRPSGNVSGLIAATLEAHGASEWITLRETWPAEMAGSVRIVQYPIQGPKSRIKRSSHV